VVFDRKGVFSRYEGTVYAVLRFAAGLMFACHGMQKILGWFPGSRPAVGSQLWVGGMIELAGGLLIAVGLFTRVAAFIASGTMAVAFVQFHWKLALDGLKWVPMVNKGELALLYCFLFLYLAARGAGPLSVDRRLGRG
jgi:putative oxidoreductase